MHRNKQRSMDGFTLVELMLAMIFVSFILIFMALTIVQMLRIYDKAVSMRQVNQAGRTITEDIGDAMRAQLPEKIETSFVNRGLLCVGQTVYRWNPLYAGVDPTTTLYGAVPSSSTAVGEQGAMMVRKVFRDPATACTIANADSVSTTMFQAASTSPLLSNRSRVIWASARQLPTTPTTVNPAKLVELSFIIGTYDSTEVNTPVKIGWLNNGNAGSYNNFAVTPHRERSGTATANILCLEGNNGNYCSSVEFKTVVYISRKDG